MSALEEYRAECERWSKWGIPFEARPTDADKADAAIAELEAALAERERQLNEAMSRLFRIDGHFASNLMGIWKNRARAEEGSE